MSTPFEQSHNPWPAFLVASATDAALIIGGFVMFQRTESIWWLVAGVAAGAVVFTPALLKLMRAFKDRGDLA